MKVNGDIKELTCSQAQLAQAIGVSRARINQLIDEKVVMRDESSKTGAVMLFDSVMNYFLSKNAAGGSVNFWQERGLHERAKRELAELKLLKSRGEVYEAAVVEGVLSELLTNFRNRLTGLPSKLSGQLTGKSRAEIFELTAAAIDEELLELSEGLADAQFSGIEGDIGGGSAAGEASNGE